MKGVPVLRLVTGDRKVSEDKLAKACGVKSLRKARHKAVRNIGFLRPLIFKEDV